MSTGGSPDAAESPDATESEGLEERVRQLGRAVLLGGGLAVLGVVGFVLAGESLQFASEKTFAIGALVFGFSLLGWSGSVFAGRGIENFQEHLGGHSDWSEADSRRAMAVLGAIGAGGMAGASLATMVLGSFG